MMDERRKSKQDRDAYDALNKQIIEQNHKHDSKSMHARIR